MQVPLLDSVEEIMAAMELQIEAVVEVEHRLVTPLCLVEAAAPV
jgi:hypothetical protein